MTIRQGEHYVVETLDQFVERTEFDWHDIGHAVEHSDMAYGGDLIDEFNRLSDATVYSVEAMDEWEIQEMIGACNIATHRAIIDTLRADDGEWVHLFDGVVNDIVKLHPGER